MPTITDLPDLIASLPELNRARFERILRVDLVEGECRVPASMRPWVEQHLGPVNEVERQRVVRVTNVMTFDGALFNPLRSKRPVPIRPTTTDDQPIEEDVFADPVRTTAEDVFGRVRGQYCVTASNVSRWEGQCAVLIFDDYDPLAITREHLRDYFRTSLEWARRANQHDPYARYFVWMWNGGLKGGASIPHAHAQMGLGRSMHYAKVEMLRRAALAYRMQHDANYFDDLLAAHEDVGLGIRAGKLKGFVYLAANRPKDTWVYGQALDDDLADAFYDGLHSLIEGAGTRAFNVAVLMPPLFPSPQNGEEKRRHDRSGTGFEDWSGFPVILRIGDRGLPHMISSDIGALDLYAHNAISVDPFEVKRTARMAADRQRTTPRT